MTETDDTQPIKILTFGEAVRRRPGMYIGEPGAAALQHLIDELVSNAVDQFLRGRASRLWVRVVEEGIIEIGDDGDGLPFDLPGPAGSDSLASHHLLNAHFAPQVEDIAPHVHLHFLPGAGVAIVNYLSNEFHCRSWRDGALWEQRFAAGAATAPPCIIARGDGRGTTFRFRPTEDLVGAKTPDRGALRAALWRAAHLFPDLRIGCGDEIFLAPSGLADYVYALSDIATTGAPRRYDRPAFRWFGRVGAYQIDAAALGVGEGLTPCLWRSWVNGRNTPAHGSHVDGFTQALASLSWTPAIAVINLTAYDPRFAGPTRDRYTSDEAREAVRAALVAPLEAHLAD